MSNMIKCTNCNTENVNNAKFCRSCGSKLVKSPKETPSSELNEHSDKHSNGFLCALSVLGFIAGIVGFFLGWPHALNVALVLGCSRAAAYYA